MLEQTLVVGGTVVFVDSLGVPHPALVTAIHGATTHGATPCINLVRVTADDTMRDNYGRQIARETSVVYRTSQPAHGMYYAMPGEALNPRAQLQA